MSWIYKNRLIDHIDKVPEDAYGFVYYITTGDKHYIGKKILFNQIKRPMGKRDVKKWREHNLKGRPPKFKYNFKESDWLTYQGSNEFLKNYEGEMTKEILRFAVSNRELTYLEARAQFVFEVLEDPAFLNDNILGKFFKGNLK